MPNESSIERKAVAFAKSLGFLCFKFTSPAFAGVPDRVFISRAGAHLYIEFKSAGKKPTPLQMRMMEKLREQYVAAGWVDNLHTAANMIKDFNDKPGSINRLYPL